MYSAVSATAAATSDANRLNISLEPKVDSNKLAAAAVRGALAVALLSALLLGARPAHAQTINDLYNPPEYGDPLGTGSLAGLVADGAGDRRGDRVRNLHGGRNSDCRREDAVQFGL